MDGSKLSTLDHPRDEETLECGLRFLRMTSRTSKLASSYLEMLDQILTTTVARNQNSTAQAQSTAGQAQETLVGPLEGVSNGTADLDTFLLDNLDPQDLLFGTGLPHDFLQTDWQYYGSIT